MKIVKLKLYELQLNLCEICDFVSNWKNGLSIHLSRKHGNIEQLDGHNDSSFSYENVVALVITGKQEDLVKYQTYFDASEIIDKSEKENLLNGRKSNFIKKTSRILSTFLHGIAWDGWQTRWEDAYFIYNWTFIMSE